jgi:hypothetical protein
MVGRDEQLAVVERAFDLACAGSPGIVLLAGEAGAGKTRLIGEFAARCGADATVLNGGCVDLGGSSLAFAPFTAALRGLTRQMGADGVAALLPGGSPGRLARLLPGVGQRRLPRPSEEVAGHAGHRALTEAVMTIKIAGSLRRASVQPHAAASGSASASGGRGLRCLGQPGPGPAVQRRLGSRPRPARRRRPAAGDRGRRVS